MILIPLLAALNGVSQTPKYITAAQDKWEGLAEVTVVSTTCGEENAFYYPSTRTVVMCKELYRKSPALSVAIFNHEMGHAFMDQHGIPNSERGADELSMLMSTPDELIAAARWFMGMAQPQSPGDPHPADLDRAASLLCYVDGIDEHPVSRACYMYAKSIDENWARMLILTSE